MLAAKLLRRCAYLPAQAVVDCGVGRGLHAMAFLSRGMKVVGVDIRPAKIDHPNYTHVQGHLTKAPVDYAQLAWCSHILEHVPDCGIMLRYLRSVTQKWLAIAVPPHRQEFSHVGHLTVWTPFHLMYNLVVNGWDCRNAIWYTDEDSIGLLVEKTDPIDLSWRTGMLSEHDSLNQYMPRKVEHRGSAWWPDNWPEEGS